MCGRYVFFSDPEQAEISRILQAIEAKGKAVRTGEIFPTNLAPAVFYDVQLDCDAFMWGFPQYNRSGVLINARQETVLEKPTFKESFRSRRCALPASGYYEWDSAKQKLLFTRPQGGLLYLGGIYRPLEGANRFVILTTAASGAAADIHHRMPIVLDPEQVEGWCRDFDQAQAILQGPAPQLVWAPAEAPRQMSLF